MGSTVSTTGCASPVTLSGNAFTSFNLWTNTLWAAEVNQAATQIPNLALAHNARVIGAAEVFYWIDTIAQVATMNALIQAVPCDSIIGLVIYDLPGRGCASGASGGELNAGGIGVYKTEFIDAIRRTILANPNTAIALIIEPDSLPNMVTNINFTLCSAAAQGYNDGIAYTLAQFNLPNVVMYVYAGNAGWLGWVANIGPGPEAKLISDVWKAAGSPGQVRGFSTNVASYNAWDLTPGEFSGDSDAQYNPAQNEKLYVNQMGAELAKNGMPNHALVDTSRNGVSYIRHLPGDWCNVNHADFGALPTSFTGDALTDAFVWVKLGGESDGTSDPASNKFFSVCAGADAFQPAPEAGQWSQAYFEMLVTHAVAIRDYLRADSSPAIFAPCPFGSCRTTADACTAGTGDVASKDLCEFVCRYDLW